MKQTEISDRGLVRLLPATYHKPPALRGLVDTDDEMEILAEIEGLTSGRLLAERGRNPHLDPRELAWQRRSRDLRIYGDSHVNAAFTYTRAGGNRFNTEERGAWYCAWDVMVSVSEVAWHRTRELGFTGQGDSPVLAAGCEVFSRATRSLSSKLVTKPAHLDQEGGKNGREGTLIGKLLGVTVRLGR